MRTGRAARTPGTPRADGPSRKNTGSYRARPAAGTRRRWREGGCLLPSKHLPQFVENEAVRVACPMHCVVGQRGIELAGIDRFTTNGVDELIADAQLREKTRL